MNRRDIELCTDLEELKELCRTYRKACFCISETLVDESKMHITTEKAKEQIRKYLRDVDYAEDKFVENLEAKEVDNKNKLTIGDRLEVIEEFTDYAECVHTYKVGEQYTINSINYSSKGTSYLLQSADDVEDFFPPRILYHCEPGENIFDLFKKVNG